MQCREREFPLLQNVQTCCVADEYPVEWALILGGSGREFVHSTPLSAEVPLTSYVFKT